MRSPGFTLVEILIVVSLLAILAAITFIVINPYAMKNRSRDAVVKSYLSRTGLSINGLAVSDSDLLYPSCLQVSYLFDNDSPHCDASYFTLYLADLEGVNFTYRSVGSTACLSTPTYTDVDKSWLWCSNSGDVTAVPVTRDCAHEFPC